MSTEHLKLDAGNNILIKCSDGDAKVPLSWYQSSFLVKDMVDNERKWASEHTAEDVRNLAEDLWLK